ncbi:MAG: S41 family peptidase [Actinobacteria bacterium]|nr:S41 family peptidase [Actinomycetota bacterium]
MRKSQRVAVVALVSLLLAAILLITGVLLGSSPLGRTLVRCMLPEVLASSWVGLEGDFPLQSEVLDKVMNTYFESVDQEALEEGAIRGMLSGLDDPYTAYFDPEEYAKLMEHTEGSYSGVGIVVEMQLGYVRVVSTFKGSPAEEAGVRPGDVIVGVDEQTVRGMPLDQVVARIKGPEGTEVKLKLYRLAPGTEIRSLEDDGGMGELPLGGESLDLRLPRRSIAPPVLESEILQEGVRRVAHITFFMFSEGSGDKLRAAVKEAVELDRVDALILDLRSNGGGLVDEAVKVAGIFLPKGSLIATTEGLHSPKDILVAAGDDYPDVTLYLLVDEFTASASEIVAGALKDSGRAVIVGEKTFGKGLIQSIQSLPNGGAVKITSAVYLTPSGADINGKGIEPDVVAADEEDTAEIDEALDETLQLISQE